MKSMKKVAMLGMMSALMAGNENLYGESALENKPEPKPEPVDIKDMKHTQNKGLLKRVEWFYDRLQKHNEEQEGRKKVQVFYVQGFAVLGVSQSKSIKKLKQLLGSSIGQPGESKENLDKTIAFLKEEIVNYDKAIMPETDK